MTNRIGNPKLMQTLYPRRFNSLAPADLRRALTSPDSVRSSRSFSEEAISTYARTIIELSTGPYSIVTPHVHFQSDVTSPPTHTPPVVTPYLVRYSQPMEKIFMADTSQTNGLLMTNILTMMTFLTSGKGLV
eukprot:GHVP01066478.1.p1 GENE.GHVP01066478.1~~GHVP01066478.1.p1  ORF type:complete len:132 (+),score=3.36 GHVP01066478.1:105-500(+)